MNQADELGGLVVELDIGAVALTVYESPCVLMANVHCKGGNKYL